MTSQHRENKANMYVEERKRNNWVVEAYEHHRRVLNVERMFVDVVDTLPSFYRYSRITSEEGEVVLVPCTQDDVIDNSRFPVFKVDGSVGGYSDNRRLLFGIRREFIECASGVVN